MLLYFKEYYHNWACTRTQGDMCQVPGSQAREYIFLSAFGFLGSQKVRKLSKNACFQG